MSTVRTVRTVIEFSDSSVLRMSDRKLESIGCEFWSVNGIDGIRWSSGMAHLLFETLGGEKPYLDMKEHMRTIYMKYIVSLFPSLWVPGAPVDSQTALTVQSVLDPPTLSSEHLPGATVLVSRPPSKY